MTRDRQWFAGAVLIAIAGLAAACARPVPPAWLPATAWWAEDAARGVARDPDELRRDDAGNRTSRVAEWAEGDRVLGSRRLPDPLRSRASRWPAVRAGLASGGLATRPDGFLSVAATGAARVDLRTLAEAENRDRRWGDAIIASLLDLDPRESERWQGELRAARAALDGGPRVTTGSRPAP